MRLRNFLLIVGLFAVVVLILYWLVRIQMT